MWAEALLRVVRRSSVMASLRSLVSYLLNFQLPLVFLSLLMLNSQKRGRVPQVSVCIFLVYL